MPKTETDIEKRNKYGMLCGIVGIFLNLILFAGKLFAGMFSGAISILSLIHIYLLVGLIKLVQYKMNLKSCIFIF